MRPPRGRRRSRQEGLPRGLHQAKRADGAVYYYTRWRVGDEDRRVTHETDDLDEALAHHHDLRARGATVRPWTLVEDAWQRWVELARSRWKPRSREDLQGRFDRYVRPLLGKKRVRDLTGDDSRRLAARLMRSGLAARTQSHILTQWSSFGRWLVEEKYVHTSPVPQGLRPKVHEKPPDPLSDEEVEKVLTVGEPHAFAVRLILATGLRWSDLVRLQAADLKPNGWLVLTCSKTGKVLRVPLGGTDPDLAREVRQRVGRLVPFSAKTGAGTFNRVVRSRSGVAFTTYRAKDTFACRWLDAGGSLTDVQQVLGHADPRTTMRYGRPSDARLMSEGQRVGSTRRPAGAAAGAGKDGEA